MARILVTGAAGFIGANLIRELIARGDEIHACVRDTSTAWRLPKEGITIHSLDITDERAVEAVVHQIKPEIVYHLAHYGGNRGQTDESMIRAVIIDGTAALYAACKGLEQQPVIIHAGSSSEYGKKVEPMKESDVAEPNTAYGCAKLWATLYGEHLRREEGMRITTLRLFSAYGPYETKNRLVPAVALALIKGELPTLAQRNVSRDFIYIDDVVQALLYAAVAPTQGIYNIGMGVNTTIGEMVESIRIALDSDAVLTWGEQENLSFDTTLWVADMTRTANELGWKPTTSLKEGTSQTVAWFKDNMSLYAD